MWYEIYKLFIAEDVTLLEIRAELVALRHRQELIIGELENLHNDNIVRDTNTNIWSEYRYYIAGGVALIIVGGVAYTFLDNSTFITGLINSLGKQCTDLSNTTISALGHMEKNVALDALERQKILLEALAKLESRIQILLEKLSTQISRANDKGLSADQLFGGSRGQKLGGK